MTAVSSNEGEFETSTTTDAPCTASPRPFPVRVLTPVSGDAGTASSLCWRRCFTILDTISPVPPITTILIFTVLASTVPYPRSRRDFRRRDRGGRQQRAHCKLSRQPSASQPAVALQRESRPENLNTGSQPLGISHESRVAIGAPGAIESSGI